MRDSYERRVDRRPVRPSVRHTLVLSQYGFHHQVSHGVLFFETKFHTLATGQHPLRRRQTRFEWIETTIKQITDQQIVIISETIEDRRLQRRPN